MEDLNITSVKEPFDCGKWNVTKDEWHIESIHSWWVQGLAVMVFGCVGILVSVIAIIVLSDKKLSGIFFNKLIIALISFDLVYLMFSICDSIRLNFITKDFKNHLYCSAPGYLVFFVIYPLRKILMCCSVYMTVVVAFERFSAVTNPITHRSSSRFSSLNMKALKYVTTVGLISVLYGIPLFFAFQIKEQEDGKACVDVWLRSDENFVLIYLNIISLIITGVAPFLLLAFFYCMIFITIKNGMKIRKELEETTLTTASSTKCLIQTQEIKMEEKKGEIVRSMILLWIVISFLICHLPRISLNIEEMLSENDRVQTMETAKTLGLKCSPVHFWALIANDWSYLLLCMNPVMNVFVYCYFSTQFQKVLKGKLLGLINCGSSFDTDNPEVVPLTSLWRTATCKTTRTYTRKETNIKANATVNEMTPLKPSLK